MLKFKTKVNNKYMLNAVIRRFGLAFAIICGLELFAILYSFGLCILLEICTVIPGSIVILSAFSKFKGAELSIVDDELHINAGPGKQWVVYDEPIVNFEFKQAKNESAANIGTMNIKGTIFCIEGIENFTEFKANVIEHCSK